MTRIFFTINCSFQACIYITVYTQVPSGENHTSTIFKLHKKEPFVLPSLFSLINYSKNRIKNEHCTAKKTKQNGWLNWASNKRAYAPRVEDAIAVAISQHLGPCSSSDSIESKGQKVCS